MEGLRMRRLGMAVIVVLVLVLGAVPSVAADTSPNGTFFDASATTTCTTQGTNRICTDINLNVTSNEDGSPGPACVGIFTFSISANGRFTPISDEFGCGDESQPDAIQDDLSVTVPPTAIIVEQCRRRSCTGSRTVTVSAAFSPTGPIAETTTRSTTKVGRCTIRTTTFDRSADLAGSITIDGTSHDASGFVDVFTSTTNEQCH